MPDRYGPRAPSATLNPDAVSVREVFAWVQSAGVSWQSFDDVARDLQLTADELAGALGSAPDDFDSVSRASELTRERAEDMAKRAGALARLYTHLLEIFRSPEAIPLWMRSESRYLAGQRPADMIREGRISRVEAALEALDYGAFV